MIFIEKNFKEKKDRHESHWNNAQFWMVKLPILDDGWITFSSFFFLITMDTNSFHEIIMHF